MVLVDFLGGFCLIALTCIGLYYVLTHVSIKKDEEK